jgi:hypothetical protein
LLIGYTQFGTQFRIHPELFPALATGRRLTWLGFVFVLLRLHAGALIRSAVTRSARGRACEQQGCTQETD